MAFASPRRVQAGLESRRLIGAAHGPPFFTMALVLIPRMPSSRRADGTKADVTLKKSATLCHHLGHLTLTAKIPGADTGDIRRAGGQGQAGCPVSKLVEYKITLDHTLLG